LDPLNGWFGGYEPEHSPLLDPALLRSPKKACAIPAKQNKKHRQSSVIFYETLQCQQIKMV
jgi:hypothetical protein